MRNNKVIWIVRTAVLIALLVTLQAITKPLGTLVTGSCVNFVLVAAVLLGGLWSGLTVALISPFMAFLLQIAPMPIYLVPGVAIGNMALVAVYWLLLNKVKVSKKLEPVMWVAAIVLAAAVKFGVLYLVIKVLIVALVTAIQGAAKAPAALFSVQQMVTAAIGGTLAMAVIKPISYAINKNK